MRLHGFDAARGILLTLGVVFHALVFVFWYVEASSVGEFLSIVFLHQLLHTFRMPAFFIIAGFFAMFLIDGRGREVFLRHRLRRITLPFLLFWPLVVSANSWATNWGKGPDWAAVFPTSDTQHLWFLYFLTLFALITWLGSPLLRKLSNPERKLVLTPPLALLAIITPFIPGVIEREIRTSTQLLFDPGVFLFYFLCYFLGLLLFLRRDVLLPLVTKRSSVYLGFGLAGFGVFFISQDWGVWFSSLAYSTAVWFLSAGVIGLFLKVASNENRALRYLADSSYWVYLVHLPLIFVFLRLGATAKLPSWPTALFAMSATLAIGLVSYQLLVRHTFIGQLLNGTRHK